jgi:hypothetical protein
MARTTKSRFIPVLQVLLGVCTAASVVMVLISDRSGILMSDSETAQCEGRCGDWDVSLSAAHEPKWEEDPDFWKSISFSAAAKTTVDADHDGTLYAKATGKFTNKGETWEYGGATVMGEYKGSVGSGSFSIGGGYKDTDFGARGQIFGGTAWTLKFSDGWQVEFGGNIYYDTGLDNALADGQWDVDFYAALSWFF